MKRKGFTLIELLAVIVVLAIIALIATPIVMNTIKSAKKGAAERSADSYISAVETTVATAKLDGKAIPDGTYQIDGEGNLTGTGLPNGKLEIDMKGNKPKDGTITIKDGQVTNDSEMTIGDYDVKYNEDNKKYEATDKGTSSGEETSTVVYRWSEDSIKIGDKIDSSDTTKYTKDASTLGKSYYLKHVLDKDSKVAESYACALYNDKEYCLRGGDSSFHGYASNESDYTGNTLILKEIKDKGVSCNFIISYSSCDDVSGKLMRSLSNGSVIVSDDTGYFCSVNDDFSSYCAG